MTNELSGLQLREAVAVEVMGWEYDDSSTLSRPLFVQKDKPGDAYSLDGADRILGIPAYESDIACAWAVEARIRERDLVADYVEALVAITRPRLLTNSTRHDSAAIYAGLIYATPEQRCRAALAAVRAAKGDA